MAFSDSVRKREPQPPSRGQRLAAGAVAEDARYVQGVREARCGKTKTPRSFVRQCILKTEDLPSQARDKHKETLTRDECSAQVALSRACQGFTSKAGRPSESALSVLSICHCLAGHCRLRRVFADAVFMYAAVVPILISTRIHVPARLLTCCVVCCGLQTPGWL
eukprot:COSAG06_NODE_413_length_16040_cov_8.901386_9_plen_164_part_00